MKKRLWPLMILLCLPRFLSAQEVYWERPEMLIPSGVQFIRAASNGTLGTVVWQDHVAQGPEGGEVYLSLLSSVDGIAWERSLRVIGPYAYQGKQVPLFSVRVDRNGRILIAVVTGETTVTVLSSADRGRSFREISRITTRETLVVPSLFETSRNEFLLLISFLKEEELGIYVTRSENGTQWESPVPLVTEGEGLSQQSLPYHVAHHGRDYIVFQAKRSNTDFQLFLKISYDGGASWSRATNLTDFPEGAGGDAVPADRISNQRPFLSSDAGTLHLAWERNTIGRSPQVYIVTLSDGGGRLSEPEKISQGSANRYNPQILRYRDRMYYLWFDDSLRGQDNVIIAWRENDAWQYKDLSSGDGNSRFPRPLLIGRNLFIFWENQLRTSQRLFLLKPDAYVESPRVTALNFATPGFGRLSELRVRWTVPEDPNGIARFYYLISRDPNAPYTEGRETLPSVTQAELAVPGEGRWYISVFAADYAGNVSRAAQVSYTRDSTPPGAVSFLPLETDDEGFLPSNTFILYWTPPPDDEIAGYAYSLNRESADLSRPASVMPEDVPVPAPQVRLLEPKFEVNNIDDGVWALSVRAIDKAGNAGPAAFIVFKLRNYIPVTYITTVAAGRNGRQELTLSIFGRGFLEGGAVDEVLIDDDGSPPYLFTLRRTADGFQVESDRTISGVKLPDIAAGAYKIGVRHPVRGLFFARDFLTVETSGVVKYGPFDERYRPRVTAISAYFLSLSFGDIMLILLLLFMAAVIVLGGRKLIVLAGEAHAIRSDAIALMEGGELPVAVKTQKIETLKKKGISLKVKFTLLISLLVVMIVLIVALPISIAMISIQQRTLAEKMYEEVDLVLGGIVEGTKTYLFEKNTLVLTENLTKQYSLLEGAAEFAIVTGPRYVNPVTGNTDLSESGELDL
ncbi:MAG TPA: exo-alpha-sialidase, partial [Spirochaetia bacterium]|nr:exo-alpha-sialidase [Spirochaetia bacterium]